MKHFLRKIEITTGLFLEDAFWDDGAYPAVPTIPAVLNEDGTLKTPAVPEVPAFAGNPIPANMIATPVPGGFHKPKWLGTAWGEGEAAATVAAAVTARQAERDKEAQDVADIAGVKGYAKLQALRGMTPVQVQAWVTTNVTTLAQAIDAVKTLAVAVSVLSRRL